MELQKQSKKENKKSNKHGSLPGYARYSGIAFQMVAIVLLFVYGGLKLDAVWKAMDFPVATLLGAIIGIILALYFVLKDLTK